jgi:excisionase family DNA binding protein
MFRNDSADDPRFYTVSKAAERLGVSRHSVNWHVKTGTIPSVRLGKRILIPRPDIDRLAGGEDAGRKHDG